MTEMNLHTAERNQGERSNIIMRRYVKREI